MAHKGRVELMVSPGHHGSPSFESCLLLVSICRARRGLATDVACLLHGIEVVYGRSSEPLSASGGLVRRGRRMRCRWRPSWRPMAWILSLRSRTWAAAAAKAGALAAEAAVIWVSARSVDWMRSSRSPFQARGAGRWFAQGPQLGGNAVAGRRLLGRRTVPPGAAGPHQDAAGRNRGSGKVPWTAW